MAKNILELIIGSFDDKKQWRAYVARVKAMPEPYRTTVQTTGCPADRAASTRDVTAATADSGDGSPNGPSGSV